MNRTARTRSWTFQGARIAVTSILLWVLFRSLDFGDLRDLLLDVRAGWVVASCGIILVVRLFIALRWQVLLGLHGIEVSLWSLSKIIFISMFAGQFLPGVIGTDIVRGYKVARLHGSPGAVAMTLLLDRVVGVYGMALIAVAGGVIAELAGQPTGLLSVIIVFFGLLLVGGGLAVPLVDRLHSRDMFAGSRWERLWRKATGLAAEATQLGRRPRALFAVLAASIAIVMLRCCIFYCLYRAFSVDVPLYSLMVFVPMMFVAVLMPISVGGLGVRETALVYFFRTIGVPAEVSVSVGIMFQFLQIVTSSPGIVFWLTERRTVSAAATAETGVAERS